jgi:hypothetical protein
VWYLSLAGEARPLGGGAVSPWRAGYELALEEVAYRGPAPNPYLVERPEEIAWGTPPAGRTRWDERLLRGSLWAERRWQPAERLEVETGVRLDAGPTVRSAGVLRPAPRLAARWEVTPQVSLSAAAGRSYQYEQALASGGIRPHDGFQSDYLWALAGDTVPPIRSDVATLGAEGWLGSRWIASANLYARRSSDVLVPNPAPGTLFTDEQRATFLTGSTVGHGLELAVRRLVGRWTAAASYTLAETRVRAGGLSFAAPGDRRHEMDANIMARLGGSWRVGAAYSAASGLPYTRTLGGEITCRSVGPSDATGVGPTECSWLQAPLLGEPGAQRSAGYQRLDLLLAWNRTFRSWEIDAFLQLHNALNWSNVGGYTGTSAYCYYNPGHCISDTVDSFLPGAPILPVLSVRVHF